MMRQVSVLAFICLALGPFVLLAKVQRYKNWSVFKIGPAKTSDQKEAIETFIEDYEDSEYVTVLCDVISQDFPIEVAVSPYEYAHVTSYMSSTGVPYAETTNNLQRTLDSEMQENTVEAHKARRKRRSLGSHEVELPHHYMLYEEINDYLMRVVNASNGRAELINIGKSYEDRDMYGIKLNGDKDLPKIWIDAGIHAREWIAPATALHVMHQLVFNESAAVRPIVDSYQWFILPMVNPDGYYWTWTENRLWRKNRSRNNPCPNPCKRGFGVDLNRNFDFNWGRFSGDNPCSLNFHGRAPFSEPESRNIRDFLFAEKDDMHIYFSLHAYLQYFVLPWVGERYRAPDYPDLERVANLSAAAMYDTHGEVYEVLNFPEKLYLASGSSMDWAKATAGVKYSYTLELRPNKVKPHMAISFQLPPTQIKPTGEEVLAGILTTASLVKTEIENNRL